MRKLIVILSIFFSLVSCSTDEDTARLVEEPQERILYVNVDTQYDFQLTYKFGNDNGVAYFEDILLFGGSEDIDIIIPDEAEFIQVKIEFFNSTDYSAIDYYLTYNNDIITFGDSEIIDTWTYSIYL